MLFRLRKQSFEKNKTIAIKFLNNQNDLKIVYFKITYQNKTHILS